MGGELLQRGGELRAGKKAGKMAAGNSGGDFLKTGKWNTPPHNSECPNLLFNLRIKPVEVS